MKLFVLKGVIMVRHLICPIPIHPDRSFCLNLSCFNVPTDQVLFLLNFQNCHARVLIGEIWGNIRPVENSGFPALKIHLATFQSNHARVLKWAIIENIWPAELAQHWKSHSISNRFFSVRFLHNLLWQGTSEFHVHEFQEGQYIFRRANTDLWGPIRIQEGQYGFRRANTDSGEPIRNRLSILERPIRNRLCILGGPIRKHIRNRMWIWVKESGRAGFSSGW